MVQVCSAALAVLCDSRKSADPPLRRHLSIVLECVELHMNTQSPGLRYQLLAALKKVKLVTFSLLFCHCYYCVV